MKFGLKIYSGCDRKKSSRLPAVARGYQRKLLAYHVMMINASPKMGKQIRLRFLIIGLTYIKEIFLQISPPICGDVAETLWGGGYQEGRLS